MASSLPADPCVALPTGSAAALRWLLAALRAEPGALADRGIEAQVEATGRPASSWRQQIRYWTPRLGAFRATDLARIVRDRV